MHTIYKIENGVVSYIDEIQNEEDVILKRNHYAKKIVPSDCIVKVLDVSVKRNGEIRADDSDPIKGARMFRISVKDGNSRALIVEEFKLSESKGWFQNTVYKYVPVTEIEFGYFPTAFKSSKSVKTIRKCLYEKDELLELFTKELKINAERGLKIYKSLEALTQDEREEIFRWCEERPRGDLLNVMGCIREINNEPRSVKLEYFQKSADTGNLLGILNLARTCEQMNKIPLAIEHYTRAVELGDISAIKCLIDLYSKEQGTKVGKERLHFWKTRYNSVTVSS